MKKIKLLVGVSIAALLAGAGFVFGQVLAIPKVINVGQSDLFEDVVGGQPSAQPFWATGPQIQHVASYKFVSLAAATPSFTFTNGLTVLTNHSTGTITSYTLTTEPNPSDGSRECYVSDVTTTAVTWTANTGQTIGTVPTAGVTNIPQCIIYDAATTTWYDSN